MKSIFQSIAFPGPWARVLIAGGCVALAALVLVWSPWRSKELWTVPSGEPATLQALKQEAVDVAERTVKAFPRDPDCHALKGSACLSRGKAAEATRSWQKCLELDPTRAGAYEGISLVAWHGGQFEEVVAACRQALKYQTDMPEVHFRLGRALIKLGRAEEAIAVAQEAVRRWSQSADAHLVLGQGYMQSGEYAKARECFLCVVEIWPDHTQAYYGLATASAKLGQRDKARQYQERFRKAMAAEKADYTDWTRYESESSEWAGQRSRTASIYARAAGIYRKHGNVQQAKRLWQRAAIICPNPP